MTRTCQICGREFHPEHGLTKYCTPDCQHKAHLLRCKKSNEDKRARRRGEIGYTIYSAYCSECGTGFSSFVSCRETCSDKCSLIRRRRINREHKRENKDKGRAKRIAVREFTCPWASGAIQRAAYEVWECFAM